MTIRSAWLPTGVLAAGCLLLTGVRAQITPELRGPLNAALPERYMGLTGIDVTVAEAEARVAAFTDYAFRVYQSPDTTATTASVPWLSAYIGFYDRQTQGRTIHSPRNCLPGAGWEVLSTSPEVLRIGGEPVTVNRVVLQNEGVQALVLYWYQARGRVAHNEYLVKWDLLRDAIVHRRTDEALVRIVVPIQGSEEDAFLAAKEFAESLKPAVESVLPAA